MHYGIDGIRYYSEMDDKELSGEMVVCTMAHYGKCDGRPCHGYHSKPHPYCVEQCFAECQHPGKDGVCILVKDNALGDGRGNLTGRRG